MSGGVCGGGAISHPLTTFTAENRWVESAMLSAPANYLAPCRPHHCCAQRPPNFLALSQPRHCYAQFPEWLATNAACLPKEQYELCVVARTGHLPRLRAHRWVQQSSHLLHLFAPRPLRSHGRQYQALQQLASTFESEPDNFPRLMELMQDLQAFGSIPAQLLRRAAPGLELTAEGLPALALSAPGDVSMVAPLGGCVLQ